MDLQLKGKKALVTGSTEGIGLAIAKGLLAEGVEVMLNGRKLDKLTSIRAQLMKEYPKANIQTLALDFSDKKMVQEVAGSLSDIDILINNVGIYAQESFLSIDEESFFQQLEVNFMSAYRLSKATMPHMMSRGWGRIISISSECAYLVPEDLINYSITKGAMHTLNRGLAQIAAGTGVNVITISPGSTLSEGAERFLENEAKAQSKSVKEVEAAFFRDVRTSSLLQRFATTEEVASSVIYCCSPLSAAVSGSVIKVDGGSTGNPY